MIFVWVFIATADITVVSFVTHLPPPVAGRVADRAVDAAVRR
jgi:hypothetical protein